MVCSNCKQSGHTNSAKKPCTNAKPPSEIDPVDINTLNTWLDDYIKRYNEIEAYNSLLSKKTWRHDNFPSAISENIAKFALLKKYGKRPNWYTEKGDLVLEDKQIEVKGFMSDGPSSFGPKEAWEWIVFVDAIHYLDRTFKVYLVPLSNTSQEWRSILINKKTFGQIADENKRGELRGSFYSVFKPELDSMGAYCECIFDGKLSELE